MRGLFRAGSSIFQQTTRPPLQRSFSSVAIHHSWANMETTSLQMRCLPVPCVGLFAMLNLRDLLEKSVEESELALTTLCTIFAGTTPCSHIISLSQLSIGPVLSGIR